jgi:hypothetical protein
MLLSCFLAASFLLSSLACASSEFHFVEPPSMRHVAAGPMADHEPCADKQKESEFCAFLRHQLTSLQSSSNRQEAVSLSQTPIVSISTDPAVLPAVLMGSATAAVALRLPLQLSPQLSNVVLRI